VGKLRILRKWYDFIKTEGEKYGYRINEGKTQLLVKHEHIDFAKELFADTNIQVITDGVTYLGSAIGKSDFETQFLRKKATEWVDELRQLSKFAETEPQAAYAALTHGLRGKWNYLFRTMDFTDDLISMMTNVIEGQLLPNLTGQPGVSTKQLSLLYLPVRDGGLGLPNLVDIHKSCPWG